MQIGIDIIAHSKSQVHKIGDRQSLFNLVTILNYSIKDQKFNETCNLEKSAIFKGVCFYYLDKNKDGNILI